MSDAPKPHPLSSTIVDKRPVVTRPKTLQFAFYGRVSTEDERGLQDRENSRAWQLRRANEIIAGHGEIVAEYFDEGYSRTIPLIRRPKGAELLDLVMNGKPEWNALVIGEAKRVFSGSQLEDVFYLLQRGGIELWIPEVGGRYDDSNLSHKLHLALEGIIGKVESETVSGRVRDSMTAIALSDDPRWLGGNPPYGYRLVPFREAEKRGVKVPLQTLQIDPQTAPVARRIFEEYLNGRSLREIAAGLARDLIPSPAGRAEWHIATLSTILDNATYTGYRVYGKQRKKLVPFDESNPRLGTETKKTRLGEPMVYSHTKVYPSIISDEEFKEVFNLRTAKRTLTAPRKKAVQRTGESEPLRGRIFYKGKKMTLDKTRHGKVRYRTNARDGVERVAVYDWQVSEALHQWLSESLSRRNLPLLIKQLKATAPKVQTQIAKLEVERTKKRTAAYNLLSLVESGDQTAIERYRLRIAEAKVFDDEIAKLNAQNLDVDGVTKLMRQLATETRKEVLDRASNQRLNRLYDALGVQIDYLPEEGGIRVNLAPVLAEASVAPPEVDDKTGEATVGAKDSAPGGTRTPNLLLRTEQLFH